jgi:hypothetical protein
MSGDLEASQRISSTGQRTNKNLHGRIASQGQTSLAQADQAGRTTAQHLKANADPKTKFAQTREQRRLASDVSDLGPLPSRERFHREEDVRIHAAPVEKKPGSVSLVEIGSQHQE